MKSYLITDPSFYHDRDSFIEYLTSIYQNFQVDFSCFRDKVSSNSKVYKELFLEISKEYGIEKTLLNSYIDDRFYGVHLTSAQYNKISQAKQSVQFVVVSTHSYHDIEIVKSLKADAITFSPVFYTPNKGEPKGVEKLSHAVKVAYPMKCFALGGIITKKHRTLCEKSGAFGFASIRYFTVK